MSEPRSPGARLVRTFTASSGTLAGGMAEGAPGAKEGARHGEETPGTRFAPRRRRAILRPSPAPSQGQSLAPSLGEGSTGALRKPAGEAPASPTCEQTTAV